MSRIFVIGDSFSLPLNYIQNWDNKSMYWVEILKKLMGNNNLIGNNNNVIVDGAPNRDTQTIIDNWIKLLPYLNSDDVLILIFPYSKRTRLALNEKEWFGTMTTHKYPNDIKIINRFIGTELYNNNKNNQYNLEFWSKQYTRSEIMKMLNPQEIINSSKSYQLNYLEIWESLCTFTKSKYFLFTWDELKYKSDVIMDKIDIEREIGEWETMNDVWVKTNGQQGQKLDFHWSADYASLFANYLYNKIIST
jgi:hypothetical protein